MNQILIIPSGEQEINLLLSFVSIELIAEECALSIENIFGLFKSNNFIE